MARLQILNKIVWLASYPKSGNTWFRAFLSALMSEGRLDINNMPTGGIFSYRGTFDMATDIDSVYLYDAEVKSMMADAYRGVAQYRNYLSFTKIHDAYVDAGGQHIVPDDVTLCGLYFLRNPLDVAGSLANHMFISIEEAITMLNDPGAKLAAQKGNLNKDTQLPQDLLDWSGHVRSWTELPTFPVLVMRYEDMLQDTFAIFKQALQHIGWQVEDEEIIRAIKACNFENLRKQEDATGFKEKAAGKGSRFFRTGTKGNWEKELTTEQISKIVSAHGAVMERYGYELP